MQLRRAIAESLERGKYQGAVSLMASRVWARAALQSLARPLSWPPGKRVIAIGGATLGGAGKTPLALSCATYLARSGVRVGLVGHAYRASPGRARVVSPDSDAARVGDEAVMCARALRGCSAEVVVAPARQAALDLAFARGADVAILDGVVQTAPTRATLALLATCAARPWGAGACPPAGDLRAPAGALLAACDLRVRIGTELGMDAVAASHGAWLDEGLLPWDDLRARKVGLVLAIARPERILAMLAAQGVHPARVVTLSDHAPKARVERFSEFARASVDLWLATAKCRAGLPAQLGGAPLATLDYALTLSGAITRLLDSIAHSAAHAIGATGRATDLGRGNPPPLSPGGP